MAMAEDELELSEDAPARRVIPCSDQTGLFFSTNVAETEMAKEMCRHCPMRAPCLRRAFQLDANDGVWGGFDEIERRYYRKLYGTDVRRIQELPAGLVQRLRRARKGRRDEG